MRGVIVAITALALSSCHPPAATPASTASVGQAGAVALPEPGVYVLQRFRGMTLPADLKPAGYEDRRLHYNLFERIIGGRLYVMPDSIYRTITCADLLDSLGRVESHMDRGPGEARLWAASGRLYSSLLVVDGPQDSSVVRVHRDTIEIVRVREVFVRDRAAGSPPKYPLPEHVCPADRASLKRSPRSPD